VSDHFYSLAFVYAVTHFGDLLSWLCLSPRTKADAEVDGSRWRKDKAQARLRSQFMIIDGCGVSNPPRGGGR